MNESDRKHDDEGEFARALELQHDRLIETQAENHQQFLHDPNQDQRVQSAYQILCLLDQQAVNLASAVEREPVEGSAPSTHKVADTRLNRRLEDEATIHCVLPNVEQFGRFEIKQQIGRGGFGIVIRARDPKLDRDVAIKIPRLEAALSSDARQRFEREARAAAALHHPGIVCVFESGCQGGIHYIASELVEGDDLATCLARGKRFTPRDSAQLLVKLADAVEHAHQRGVLHRDLKPSNILLPEHDAAAPVITDFGLASIVNQQEFTQTGAVVGTPSYMSPEQASGSKRMGPATDVYGLGTVLYQLLTRRPPFADLPLVETLRAIVVRDPASARSLVAEIPRDLDAICSKCLEKDPSRRYQTAHELQTDLQRFLDGQPVVARPVRLFHRTLRGLRRNPVISVLGFALFVGLVAGLLGMIALWQRSEHNRKIAERNEQKYIHKSEQMVDAVNRLFAGLAVNQEIRQASADGLRKTLLQEANRFQAQFLSDVPEDADSQLEYARSLFSLADISLFLGDAREAARLASRAIDFFEKAERDRSLDPNEKLNAVLLMGRAYTRCGDFSKANEAFDETLIRLASRMDSERPSPISGKQLAQFASAFTNQAYSLHHQDRLDDAFTSIEVARQLWLEYDLMTREKPIAHDLIPMDRGLFHYVSAESLRLMRDYSAAADSYDAAIDKFKIASRYSEAADEANHLLAKCLRGQGITYAEQNESTAAIECYEAAIVMLQPLVDAHPLVEVYSSLLSQVRYSLSTSLMVAGELELAEAMINTNIAEKRKLIETFPDSESKYFSHLGDSLNVRYIILYRSKAIDADESARLLLATIDAFQSAIDLNPQWTRPRMAMARVQINLGFLYARQKNYDRSGEMIDLARRELDDLIRAEPDWSEAIDAYYGATMNDVSLQVQVKNYRTAIDLVEQLLLRFSDHPRNHKTRLGMSVLLAHVERFDDAHQQILNFVEHAEANPEHFIQAAEKAAQICELDEVKHDPDLVNQFDQLATRLVQRGKPNLPNDAERYLDQVRSSRLLSARIIKDPPSPED